MNHAMPDAEAARVSTRARDGLIVDPAFTLDEAAALFDAEGDVQRGRGRGAVRRVMTTQGAAIVRHYRRGGWMARLSDDRFFWSGSEAARPFREFRITAWLHRAGLPVPRVVAGRWQRDGLWYRADLATMEIDAARTLTERLQRGERDIIDWSALGRCLARFHRCGVWHADLNAHNILFDGGGSPHLIDFDRARRIDPASSRLHGNLDRLARSLRKIGHGAVVDGAPWRSLLDGYAACRADASR